MRAKRKLFAVSVFAVVILVAGWIVSQSTAPKFVPPPLPSPNGFAGLLEAEKLLHSRTGFYDEMEEAKLIEVVAHNESALEIAREALKLECGVPIDWTWDPAANGSNPELLDQVQAMRALARAFVAEGRARLNEGNLDGAIESGIDTYRLGTECNRGGLIVGYLVGNAIRTIAINELRSIATRDPQQRRVILEKLLPLHNRAESADQVIQRETDYINSASRGLMGWYIVRQSSSLMQPTIEATLQSEKRAQAIERLFVLHMAIELYHEKHDLWPTSQDQLVPDFLVTVPVDPYTQASFMYESSDDGYALYSVGPNGVDDGGKETTDNKDGDLLLESASQ